MKYILRGVNDYLNPIETILKNRSISEDLFNLTSDVLESYSNYDNIQKGIDMLLKHINDKNKLEIVIDSDVDGLTSGAVLYKYIKDTFNYDNLYYKLHTGKQHGLSEDIKIDNDTKLIILPDASSNDYEQHKKYHDEGVDILVLDHHECEYESKYAVVINNQLSKNVKNKNLSGVGIVFKFINALDDYLFINKADHYKDLVALGNVADVMLLSEKETRFLCYEGIKNTNNLFIKALIEKNEFQLEGKYNINKLGWVIAPKLNGTIRSGTQEVKEHMFKAFISNDYNYCLEVADKCKLAKEKQDRDVKSSLSKIEKNIKMSKDDRCLLLEVSNALSHSHTGLVAGKLQEKYGVPTLLYRNKQGSKTIVGGSGRGNDNITNDFRQDLEDSKLFEFVTGHSGAFGFEIKKENIDNLKTFLNNLYSDKEIINGKTYEVDLILNEESLSDNIICTIAHYEDEWGNGIPEPLIVFENIPIYIDENNIKGTRSKTLIFEFNGVKFVKKFLSNDLKDRVLNKGNLLANIIGKCINNIYNANSYPQVEIVDIEIM